MKTGWQLWDMEQGSKTAVTSQKLRPGAHDPCSRVWNIFLALCSYDSPAFPLHWSSTFTMFISLHEYSKKKSKNQGTETHFWQTGHWYKEQQWHILTAVFQPFRWESWGSWGSSQSIKVLCLSHRNCNDQHRADCKANTQRSFLWAQ